MASPGVEAWEHREVVTSGRHQYAVQVGGALDGENTRDPVGYGNYGQAFENNVELLLENTGEVTLRNPRLTVNGARRWHSLPEVLAGVVRAGMSEEARALACWEFARRHRQHGTTCDDEVKDTVRMLNCYGYTLCWDEAFTLSNLWQAAGLRTRRGLPHGHCTTEVHYDGAWHLLDSDEHLQVLCRDNTTVAGEAEIARDHDLLKRSHAYGILAGESHATAQSAAALFTHTGRRGGPPRAVIGAETTMAMDLRPGEALAWGWAARPGKYRRMASQDLGPIAPPPRCATGTYRYRPRLDAGWAQWPSSAANVVATAGGGLAAVDGVHASALEYTLATPYPVVGGRVALAFVGAASPPPAVATTLAAEDGHCAQPASSRGR
jgi:hypothetical protein